MGRSSKTKYMRMKVLPDKLFHSIWKDAQTLGEDELIDNYIRIHGKKYVDFETKFGMDQMDAMTMVKNIKAIASCSFKELLAMAGKRKVDVSHTFCIPIRTIEEWYSGNNVCAPYVRLMIIREYHLLSLGKYVHLESELEKRNSAPGVYVLSGKYRKNKEKEADDASSRTEISHEDLLESEEEDFLEADQRSRELEDILSRYEKMVYKENASNSSDVQDILKRTQYLSGKINRRS